MAEKKIRKDADSRIQEIRKVRNSIVFMIAAVVVYIIQAMTIFADELNNESYFINQALFEGGTVSSNIKEKNVHQICVNVDGIQDGKIYNHEVDAVLNASGNKPKMTVHVSVRYKNYSGEVKDIECVQKNVLNNNYNISRQYSEPGIYEIIFYAEGEGGCKSNEEVICFAIDTVAPKVKIEGVTEGGMYNCKKEIPINVFEEFYKDISVNVEILREDEKGGKNRLTPEFICKAVNNTNIYNLTEDGKYTITVNAKDSCGNESENKVSFFIDKTAPFIELFNGESSFENSNIINKLPEFSVVIKDAMFNKGTASVSLLKKRNNGIFEKTVSKEYALYSDTSKYSIPVVNEGMYMLTVEAMDSLGNKSSKTVYFTLDESPPVIGYFSDFNERYLKNFSLPQNASKYITDMTNVSYHAYLNDKETNGGNIKKDGKYILQIVAEDEAGNVSEEEIAFIIDNTKPTVIVSGLDTEGNVEKNTNIRLSLFDSDDYFENVTVNGEEIVLPHEGRYVDIPVNNYGDYEINVKANDSADNKVEKTIVTSCNVLSGGPNITMLSGNIKKLTKSDNENSVNNFSKNNTDNVITLICIIASFVTITLVIFAVFTFVDTDKKEC